tara:strand:- start:10 stop:519 length:510 start_codon:yes stop_codon:yes gene_type:complete
MIKKSLVLILFLCFVQFKLSVYAIEAHFDKDCEKALIGEIEKAKKEIKVAIYSFTRFSIANALKNASKKGVKVQIIWDKTQFGSSEYSEKIKGILEGSKVEVILFEGEQKMHHKFAIIDSETVVTGSFNFTTSASKFNYENLVIIKETGVAEKFSKAWEKIFQKVSKKD